MGLTSIKQLIRAVALLLLPSMAVAQPTLQDTTRFTVFDPVKSWVPNLAALKTYMFPSQTGNSGKYLTTDGSVMSWGTVSGGSGNVATDAIWDAKGDLAVGTGANTASRLAVGTDGKQIYADAAEATGLRWGPSTISPAQITSNQNDFTATGWDKAQIVRLSTDSEIRAVTSFAATFDGDTKLLENIGDYTISIPCEHESGTAANRVAGHGDFFLHPRKAVSIVYDGTSSRWRLVMPGRYYDVDNTHFFGEYIAGGNTASSQSNFTWAITGTGAGFTGSNANYSIPGANTLSTGTTTTGSVTFYHKTITEPHSVGDMEIFGMCVLSIPTLSDATDRFTASFAIENTPSNTSNNNNSVYIRYSDNINSGKWLGVVRNNSGTETTVDLGITVAAATVYKLEIFVNKQLSEVLFYINGVYSGHLTTGMPTTGTSVGPRVLILKSAGTTARTVNLHRLTHGSFIY